MKCFYHRADLDGQCSGAIVKFANPDCEMIGMNYDDKFPWNRLTPNEDVWVVDFCLQPFEDMLKLNELVNLRWIDHHKTSIDNAHEIGFIAGKYHWLTLDKAACEMTWEACFPDQLLPISVFYLGRYDIWKHEDVPGSLAFQYGMRFEEDTRPDNQGLWKEVFYNPILVADMVKRGELLLEYEKRQNTKYAKSCAFEIVFDSLRCIVLNKGMANSLAFSAVYDPTKHDAMMAFVLRNGKWNFSLYADKPDVDVSAVCKARGGGGHKGAAGFSADTLPF